MNQWYRASIKIGFEAKNGQMKYRKENYIVSALSPTDVEKKLATHLGTEDYEIISIAVTAIAEVIK
jgi:hypothetical protein